MEYDPNSDRVATDLDISPRLRRELEKRIQSREAGQGLTAEQVRERFECRRAAKRAPPR